MTTITIEKDVKLDKYSFTTIKEFERYLKEKKNDNDIDFREEQIDSLDSDFLQKIAYAKKQPLSAFVEL